MRRDGLHMRHGGRLPISHGAIKADVATSARRQADRHLTQGVPYARCDAGSTEHRPTDVKAFPSGPLILNAVPPRKLDHWGRQSQAPCWAS